MLPRLANLATGHTRTNEAAKPVYELHFTSVRETMLQSCFKLNCNHIYISWYENTSLDLYVILQLQ